MFCKEIYKDVSTLIKNENNSEGKEHIKKLFEGYPVDFKKLYDNIKTNANLFLLISFKIIT